MKNILNILLLMAASTGTAIAGSVQEPAVPIVSVTPPAAQGWSGFYAGASANFDRGNFDFYNTTPYILTFNDTLNGTMYGGFVGYNIQRGAMVYGGELAYSAGNIAGANLGFNFRLTSMLDLKARVGYAISPSLLAYGVAGGSFGQLDLPLDPNFSAALSGFNFGAGVEYKIGAHMIVGAEYLVRNVAGDTANGFNISEVQTQSAQVRVGWQF